MRGFVGLVLCLVMFPTFAFAARPLSTDDTGTVDKGHWEVECGFEYADTQDDEYTWAATLKCGMAEKWDLGVEIPYQYIEVTDGDDVNGIGDVVISSKYRLWDETKDAPSLALGFSIKTETGDEGKGLSTGEVDYALTAILSKELEKIIGHLNLGCTFVGAPEGETGDDVFSYALALEYPFSDVLNLVAELSGETVFEGDFDANPFAGLVGLNYSICDAATFDFGLGFGISEASPDYKIVTGLTLGF